MSNMDKINESAIDQIISWWNNEDNLITNELNGTSEVFLNFLNDWSNTDKREVYENTKDSFVNKYGIDPAKFIGYIEDNPEMWKDVKDASQATNVDPNILYSIGMQEGFVNLVKSRKHTTTQYYPENHPYILLQKIMGTELSTYTKNDLSVLKGVESEHIFTRKYTDYKEIDNFQDVGLDTFWEDQHNLLSKGYLDKEIERTDEFRLMANESGYPIRIANMAVSDGWKATGAMIKQHEEYVSNIFNNNNLDFNNLDSDEKLFWIYASFNAGPGNASKLLDAYGPKPLENKELLNEIQGEDREFIQWMNNVIRTVGSNELLSIYNPFE